MVKLISLDKGIEFNFYETNNIQIINNMLQNNYNLGVIRYQIENEKYFENILKKKNLLYKTIWEFEYVLLMSSSNPLASKNYIAYEDVSNFIEVVHGDNNIPSLPLSDVAKMQLPEVYEKRIFVYERGSQFELLSDVPTTYMWVSPIPQELINRHSLVQRKCKEARQKYKDVLIWKKGYRFTELDNIFIREVEALRNQVDDNKIL